MRFFLAAPVFGMLAAGLLFFGHGALPLMRWAPAALAATHLWTLGFITMTMLGALWQVLPVLLGVILPRREWLSAIVFGLLTSGALALAAAFIMQTPWLFGVALAVLEPTLLLVAVGLGLAGLRATQAIESARVIRLALAGLAVPAALGGWLAAGHAGGQAARQWTSYHVAWGVAGWALMLVIGVSRQVLPIFLTTPPYPRRASLLLAIALFSVLLASGPTPGSDRLIPWLGCAATLGYAALTTTLLLRRRRRQRDISQWFWLLGMTTLALGAMAAASPSVNNALAGIWLLAGFAGSVINGMLYKISPLLVWLHLRLPALLGRLPPGVKRVSPNIHEIIPLRRQARQFALHLTAILLLSGAVFTGELIRPGATALFLSQLLLLINLTHALRVHKNACATRS